MCALELLLTVCQILKHLFRSFFGVLPIYDLTDLAFAEYQPAWSRLFADCRICLDFASIYVAAITGANVSMFVPFTHARLKILLKAIVLKALLML